MPEEFLRACTHSTCRTDARGLVSTASLNYARTDPKKEQLCASALTYNPSTPEEEDDHKFNASVGYMSSSTTKQV